MRNLEWAKGLSKEIDDLISHHHFVANEAKNLAELEEKVYQESKEKICELIERNNRSKRQSNAAFHNGFCDK